MKAIQIRNYIKGTSKLNRTGLLSAFAIFLLALACLYPISKSEQTTEAVTGTAQSSSLTLDVTSASASVDLEVSSTNGTFAASNVDAAFSVSTNNFSGYTLSIVGSDDNGLLTSTDGAATLSSLTEATTEASFSAVEGTALNGKWGYKPSKLNSQTNTNYLPAPTTTASTLDVTAAANNTSNSYTIALGARTDYNTPSATYSNTFAVTAVSNPINYVITYDANTEETVTNMPEVQSNSTSATSITLANNTPVRDGYDFKGWCTTQPTEANPETCSGQTFQPGGTFGIDKTTSNVTTLYAIWEAQGPTVTYDANGGYFNGNTSQTTNAVRYTVAAGTVTKYSHTSNVDDTGAQNGNYNNNLNTTDVVTIPGAAELKVTITYQTEGTTDWVAIYDGSATPSSSNYSSSITGKLGSSTKTTKEYNIPGDTAQFFFHSDGSVGYYGYYAVVTGIGETMIPETEVLAPSRQNYDFLGWYADIAGTTPFIINVTTRSQTVYAKWRRNFLQNATTMQNLTQEQCDASDTGATTSLSDVRDNNIYKVTKINGFCWMTQNLNYDLASHNILSPSTSDVLVDTTLNVSTSSLFNSSYYAPANIRPGSNDEQGYYYNYCAATAGEVCANIIADATQSICPAGWRLPNYEEHQSLADYVKEYDPNLEYTGYYENNEIESSDNSSGQGRTYWWSSISTGSSGLARMLQLYQYKFSYVSKRFYTGNKIRCIKKYTKPILTITFDSNGGTDGSMDQITIDTGTNDKLPANNYTKTGYSFISWNTKRDGTGDIYYSETVPNYVGAENKEITLYAQWGKNIGAMQTYTNAQCSNDASGAPVVATDVRDNKTYSLRYINGSCIMTQNLSYDVEANKTLSPTTSNVQSSITISDAKKVTSPTSAQAYEPWFYVPNDNDLENSNLTTDKVGYYYNYCLASAATSCTSPYVSTIQDICPSGWHMPTKSEFDALIPYIDKNNFLVTLPGFIRNYKMESQAEHAYWFSSEVDSGSKNVYYLYYGDADNDVQTSYAFNQSAYMSVRCIRSS